MNRTSNLLERPASYSNAALLHQSSMFAIVQLPGILRSPSGLLPFDAPFSPPLLSPSVSSTFCRRCLELPESRAPDSLISQTRSPWTRSRLLFFHVRITSPIHPLLSSSSSSSSVFHRFPRSSRRSVPNARSEIAFRSVEGKCFIGNRLKTDCGESKMWEVSKAIQGGLRYL